MSYENVFNELKVIVLDKNKKFICEFELSYNYTDTDTYEFPDIDVRFITKSINNYQDELQNKLVTFSQNARSRERFMRKKELTVIYDENNDSICFVDEMVKNNSDMKCPFCECEDIESLEVNMDVGECSQEMFCTECQKDWTNIYRLETYVVD